MANPKPVKPLDWNKPLVLNDGRQARLLGQIAATQGGAPYVVAVMGNGDPKTGSTKGVELVWFYNINGCYPGGNATYPYSLNN